MSDYPELFAQCSLDDLVQLWKEAVMFEDSDFAIACREEIKRRKPEPNTATLREGGAE